MTASTTDNNKLRLAGLLEESITDGPGLRLVVFTQGCPHHCNGCHNPETHAEEGGQWWNLEDIFEFYRQNPLLDGITFSGGEPFLQPAPLAALASLVHDAGGNVLTYTGYSLTQLQKMHDMDIERLLAQSDYLVDGHFIEALASLELKFRGSSNQKVWRNSPNGFVACDF